MRLCKVDCDCFLLMFSCVQGKSAALGLSVAAAIGYGYSNIFVTAPHPENLKTVFEFIFKACVCRSHCFVPHTIVCLSFHPMSKEHVHALKGLAQPQACRAGDVSAAACLQVAAASKPQPHACGKPGLLAHTHAL